MLRSALAALVAFTGIVLSIYLGLVIMFVGGVEQIVDQFNAETVDGGQVAWGILRVLFASGACGLGILISVALASLVADSE